MIPIYAPPKKFIGEIVPPAVTPPAMIGVSGTSKHNSIFDGTSIWFANSGGISVYKYNITTLTFQEFLTGSMTGAGMAFDGTYVYVTGFSNNWITKLNTSGTTIATFNSTLSGTHQIIYDSGVDALFVTGYWSGEVAKLSKTGSVLAKYTAGKFPLGIVTLGNYVYVTCFDYTTTAQGAGKVVKLNKTDLTLVATWDVGVNPSDITTDDTNLWITALKGGYVYKVNPSDGSVLATYNTGIVGSYQTSIRHIANGFNLLAITVTEDYRPDDVAGTYNKIHFLKESDGSSFLVADSAGFDLRNGSLDTSNYVWFGGFADGSVTRVLLTLPTPPVTGILLHFSTYPIVNSYSADTVITDINVSSPLRTTAAPFDPYSIDTNYLHGFTPISYKETADNTFGSGDFSVCCRAMWVSDNPGTAFFSLIGCLYGWELGVGVTGGDHIIFRYSTDGVSWTNTHSIARPVNALVWLFYLVERIGNTLYIYSGRDDTANVTLIGSFPITGTIHTSIGRNIQIGGGLAPEDSWTGEMDEVRVNKTTISGGVSSFPKLTAPFTS